MATRTVLLPRPLDHQLRILLHNSRFKLLMCGRRWGKTATGLMASIAGHGPTLKDFKGAASGATIWWVGPTYKTIDNSHIWDDLQKACNGAWLDKREVDKRITLPGGGSITIRSAEDPNSLRGPGLDGVIVDEAAFLSVDAWENSIRPALADKQGWAILCSTPNGRNWFYERYCKAVEGRKGWKAWKLPSSQNPLVTSDELEDIKDQLGPRRFAQEHEAEPMQVEGAMWPGDYFGDDIWCDEWPDHFERKVIAVDPSLGASELADYSAIVFVGLTRGLFWIDADIERRSPGQIVEDTVRMCSHHEPDAVGVESNGFQTVLGDMFDNYCSQHNMPPLPLHMIHNSEKKEVRIE